MVQWDTVEFGHILQAIWFWGWILVPRISWETFFCLMIGKCFNILQADFTLGAEFNTSDRGIINIFLDFMLQLVFLLIVINLIPRGLYICSLIRCSHIEGHKIKHCLFPFQIFSDSLYNEKLYSSFCSHNEILKKIKWKKKKENGQPIKTKQVTYFESTVSIIYMVVNISWFDHYFYGKTGKTRMLKIKDRW